MSPEDRVIVIGASAGALFALSEILPELPADFPIPILLVVHLPPDGKNLIPEILRSKCRLEVHEGEDKEEIRGGTVYVAPPNYHLLVEEGGHISLSIDDAVNFSRPAIDPLFETAADAFGANVIGVVLTGGNEDGARGLRRIIDAGGHGIVENPEFAHTPAMPRAALELCSEAQVLARREIVTYLKEVV